ncbi:uncharacterized protein si:ch73-70k4.1 [Cheilinus undulatus]|uniref:uncharacterized protein si:ch73-70k4.1 n=1 Tax=Cheilinus undulatus TaxID=241271 RepID=UPI001BD67D09|nr:uncharacterized protein si:ch73-70k4.1 [Cheilinus undulatus]
MAENYSKSKLKRKKYSAEDLQPDVCSRGAQRKGHGNGAAEPGRSAVPADVWWNREQLPAVDALWALTLKSALPYLQNKTLDLIPDLPEPSTARPSAAMADDQGWCGLSLEVPPFPELSTRTPSSPPAVSSSHQDLPAQTQPAADTPEHEASSNSRKHLRPSLKTLNRRTESVGGGEEKRDDRQLLQNQRRVSDSPVFMEEEAGNTEEVMEDGEGEVQGSMRKDGGAAGGEGVLQSCPMCLLVFPAGFTQMDCDGHLAKCLSEVNVDVTW